MTTNSVLDSVRSMDPQETMSPSCNVDVTSHIFLQSVGDPKPRDYVVSRKAASSSLLLDRLLRDPQLASPTERTCIPIPNATSRALSFVVAFLEYHTPDRPFPPIPKPLQKPLRYVPGIEPWDMLFLGDLVSAAASSTGGGATTSSSGAGAAASPGTTSLSSSSAIASQQSASGGASSASMGGNNFAGLMSNSTLELFQDVTILAGFLHIAGLVELLAAYVAEQFAFGKVSVEDVRARFSIVNDFSEDELKKIREENKWAEDPPE